MITLALLVWIVAMGFAIWRPRGARPLALAGALALVGYLAWRWISLERPPLRTLGETRLWYATALGLLGVLLSWRLQRPRLLIPTLALGGVFLVIALLHPDQGDRTLRPALISPWFVPHVATYLLAYACLTLAAVEAARAWLFPGTPDSRLAELQPSAPGVVPRCRSGDRRSRARSQDAALLLLRLGLPLLTLGMIMGAVWARIAWGHYWAWDPKETWALLTWISTVAVHHHAERCPQAQQRTCILLLASTIVLGLCWFAVQYLPAAQTSVHTYAQDK